MNRIIINVLVLIVVLLPTIYVSAQDAPGLLEMLALHPGREAAYINIYDSTGVNFQEGVYIYSRFFRSEAMVLRKGGGGVASAASPVITDEDNISINAYTITPEGDTITVPSDEMTALELYGNKKRHMISFPDARAGAIFVFEWRLNSTEPVFSGRRFLGRTYPVNANRTVISSPTNWIFKFLIQPSCLCRRERSREYILDEELWVNYVWVGQSLPGLVFEQDSPPASQYIPCLYYVFSYDKRWDDIENNRIDWPLIARSYGDHLDNMGKPGSKVKDEVKFLTREISGKQEKLRRVVSFISANFQTVYSDIDISDSPWDLLARGYGSQAEAAMLVGTFLNLIDIPFDYILISTRDSGEPIKTMPALFYFNRLLVAARIDQDTVWVDPFYRGAPLGVLPFEDQAVEGLKIGDNYKEFLTTPASDYRENGHMVRLRIGFDQDGQLTAEGVEMLFGALNTEEKNILQSLSEQDRFERWSNLTSGGISGSSLSDLEFSDIYSDINPFKVTYKLSVPGYVNPDERRLYIPMDILGRWQLTSNYGVRQLPLELGRPYSEQERITIEIPPGYKVEFLPENFTLNSYLGEILSVAVVTANTITITRGLGIKPYRLKASAAESLTGFFSTASDKAGQYIVLRK
ncbi:MAG: DUF3857 domain-containing protein [candidate division Zixibacteria bacterium]|nr:DUF3857 domain-containing protein [candidate division Zixibacteria bacterium]